MGDLYILPRRRSKKATVMEIKLLVAFALFLCLTTQLEANSYYHFDTTTYVCLSYPLDWYCIPFAQGCTMKLPISGPFFESYTSYDCENGVVVVDKFEPLPEDLIQDGKAVLRFSVGDIEFAGANP